jgi:hypothetical protein
LLEAVRWLVGATDWSTAGILALIVLADGLRRAHPSAVLVRRVGTGRWVVVGRGARQPRLTLVSWGAPLVTSLLLPDADGSGAPDSDWRARFDRLNRSLPLVYGLAGVALVLVVLGVPVATGALGGRGFLLAVAAVLAVCLTTATAGWWLVRRHGDLPRGAAGWAAHLLSPFSAPRAAELVLERCCAGRSQVGLVRALLAPEDFEAWIRPRAFDRVQPGAEPDAGLEAVLAPEEMRALVARPPAGAADGELWCRRCGATYGEGSDRCADCDLALVRNAGS